MRYNFILDYETIGQDVFNIPVVNCSYYIFDWTRFTSNNPYTFDELINDIQFDKFNVEEQHKAGYRVTKDGMKWWKDQSKAALEQVMPSDSDISIVEFTDRFIKYLGQCKIDRWWSRSNTFDPILLHRNFKDHSSRTLLDKVLPFWKVRDIRTYIDTRYDFKSVHNNFCPIDDQEEWKRIFVEHNSVHDVAADILRLQRIERVINCD